MAGGKVPHGYWNNKQRCLKEAGNYKTITEFVEGSSGCARACEVNGWWQEAIKNYKPGGNKTVRHGHWTYENIKAVIGKCNSRHEFKSKFAGAYAASITHGWEKKLTKHWPPSKKILPRCYYNSKSRCRKEALKYKTRSEFYFGSPSAYRWTLNNKWFADVAPHLGNPKTRGPNKVQSKISIFEERAEDYPSYRYWVDRLTSRVVKKFEIKGDGESLDHIYPVIRSYKYPKAK